MNNKSMERYLETGDAIAVDVVGVEVEPGVFKLPEFVDGKDYCDAGRERWVWSIGRDIKTDEIFASLDCRFYTNPSFECLWLR